MLLVRCNGGDVLTDEASAVFATRVTAVAETTVRYEPVT